MSEPANPTPFDTLTAKQTDVLQALAEGLSVTAAAARAGVHRSTVHLWTRDHPTFSRAWLAARQERAEHLADSLADLHQLACDTFRQILSDDQAPASVRLKAAMEIVKLVQNQRPTELAQLKTQLRDDRVFNDLALAQTANQRPPATPPVTIAPEKAPVRNAPCPCGSRLKYKRCCGHPVTQARAA